MMSQEKDQSHNLSSQSLPKNSTMSVKIGTLGSPENLYLVQGEN